MQRTQKVLRISKCENFANLGGEFLYKKRKNKPKLEKKNEKMGRLGDTSSNDG